jgi:sortase A
MDFIAMGSKSLKSRLGWLEVGFYLGGVALLAVFFYIKSDSESQSQEGIRAFQQAAESHSELQQASPGQASLAVIGAPDVELWAKGRIAKYEKSLQVAADAPLAIMKIDALGIQVPVFDGADDFNLNRGVARIKGTARVDAEGNLGIAGHRDSFFRGLKDISMGDRIEIQTVRGTSSYEVSSIEIVDPSEISVLLPTAERTITLVTCYPFYYVGHAPKRYIVKATAEHLLAKT